ncbi:MAG TPA: class I SAM-dependent methyltransferase [Thermoanaerobaculaceae bacterium]|nr:class I SAM-dependent methyltransferase [Thermoanaerobaculaceae bacterium]HRS15974.1 class I SAM-dependent methyltransferase [Thermoanaerobaculaceae bacterium]
MTADPARENADQTITLLHVREIHRYNDWVFSYLAPHVRGRVLEVGCGIGTYSTRLRPLAASLHCVDMNPSYSESVGRVFRDDPGVSVAVGVLGGGLSLPDASFDTIVCLNVIEHVQDDHGAVRHLAGWLAPGGVLLVQVPAHQWLYGSIDASLGHYRRYTARQLASLLEGAGLALVASPRHLFGLGIVGWWLYGRVLRRRAVPEQSVRVSNLLAGLSRRLEAVLRPPLGLTLVAGGRAAGGASPATRPGRPSS